MTASDGIDRLRAALAGEGGGTSDFDLNPGVTLPPGRVLRPAGVLIAVLPGSKGLDVLLTKRSPHLKHHPGQIAFPGGKQDACDATALDAALREAEEEVGLPRAIVEPLGTLPPHETVTGFAVTPLVGLVTQPFQPVPEKGEVAEIFRAPLHHVTNPSRYRIEGRRWQGRRRLYFVVPWGPYYIWGATARMLRALADRMAQCD